jgi:8-amino-7-oxononanoate synthase
MHPLQPEIDKLQRQQTLRRLTPSDPSPQCADATQIERDGKSLLLFGANDYLGLSRHPAVAAAAISAIQKFGVGAGASRLLSGNCSLYATLESRLSQLKGTESALLFTTGYMANVGALGALIGSEDLILSDRLNHASLIEGARLSKGLFRLYPHQDLDPLKKHLARRKTTQRAFILTEGVFSMEGDITPLPDLLALAEAYDATIYLDDAHATGVLGPQGEGTCAHFNLRSPRILQMGTLSKALGSLGGFLATDAVTVQYLLNKARTFVYTTALPPPVLAAALAALDILRTDDPRRRRLRENIVYFRTELQKLGFDVGAGETPIVPLYVGESEMAQQFSQRLLDAGFYVPAIRPPTVPSFTSRLRISLMADHTRPQMDSLLLALRETGSALGLIP